MGFSIKGFIGEAARAVVEYNKRKVRDGKTSYFLAQKKQMWYTMMYAMDGMDENDPKNAVKKAPQEEIEKQ